MLDALKFPELNFDETRHLYSIGREVLTSVTTIMKPLSDAYYGGIDKERLTAAAQRGKIVHGSIENYLLFGVDDIPLEYEGYYSAFKSWMDEEKPEIISTEGRIYHKTFRYAGTSDLSCVIRGQNVCVDFKTSAEIVEMLARVQLEAYNRAFISHGIKHDTKAIVHLRRDGKYKIKTLPGGDSEAWEVFSSLLITNNYLKKYRR